MRNNLKHRTLLERGGLMIEALAMLGLIAVVTPTMYKKSAERTMEVDDINTATTIRSYINAAEAYMATNYVPLMKDFQAEVADLEEKPAQQYKQIENDDLADFLPYKFKSASSLYDYNEPKITVVKNANNLTAFLLFPAKAGGDDGLGQERTARIASLVGANGGYVRSEHNARGVGGIWSLSGSTYTDVFPDDNSQVYSIVASTSNAVNGSTQAGDLDNPKYLQRTYECPEDTPAAECEDEKWRNTMRTDLYLGGYTEYDELPDDNPSDEKMHNIRNIGSMIVGAERVASTFNGVDGYSGGLDVANGRYGLYIAEDIDNTPTKTDGSGVDVPNQNPKSNAYIGGSLMAGLRKFFVSKDTLNYGPRTKTVEEGGTTSTVGDGYNFSVDSDTGDMKQYGNLDLAHNFDNYSNSIVVIGAGDSYSDYILKARRYAKSADNYETKLVLMGSDDINLIELDSDYDYDLYSSLASSKLHGGQVNIGHAHLNNGNTVGAIRKTVVDGHDVTENISQAIEHINYQADQKFPVIVGKNTYVQGLLAADQLDTQKLRTASFSSGSEHVDDEFQWFNVDQSGVTIESLDGQRPATGGHTSGVQVNVNDNGVAMRYGGTSDGPKAKLMLHSDRFSDDGHGGMIPSPSGAIRDDYAITGTAKNITMKTENAGTLALKNDNVRQEIHYNNITFSGPDDDTSSWTEDMYSNYYVKLKKHGSLNLEDSGLNVVKKGDGEMKNVFTVSADRRPGAQSNTSTVYANTYDSSLYEGSGQEFNYDIAMHGNVLFTSEMGHGGFYNSQGGYLHKYMTIGTQTSNPAYAAGIEVVAGESYSNAHRAVVFDLSNDGHTTHADAVMTYSYSDSFYYGDNNMTGIQPRMDAGTVYIRKGAVDVLPIIPAATAEAGDTNSKSATEQKGYIAAGRFVANNRDSSGNLVKVPDMITDAKYNAYNGSSNKSGRYDTYMVNPAYTSVMHDIKLTTRGGARLSDVLPNFIIKAIYISTNDKDDTISTFKFRYSGGTAYCGGGNTPCPGNSNGDLAASPYTGYVPAPQCPPGYARVLTFTPVSMYMGQAGQLAKGDSSFLPGGYTGNKFHVEENLMSYLSEAYSGDGDQTKIKEIVPAYRRAKLRLGNESAHTMKLSSSDDGISNATFSVSEVYGLEAAGQGDSYSEVYPMVLTAANKENIALPFVFQQNTWLKTLSVPMCANTAAEYKPSSSDCAVAKDYVNSWALLMGFVYSQALYETFMGGADTKKASPEFYWNVFPVNKYSLEGTATTYCYFNRTNLGTVLDHGQVVDADTVNFQNHTNMISQDEYLSLQNTSLPTSYEKINDDYVKRLNDPTLKYNEKW